MVIEEEDEACASVLPMRRLLASTNELAVLLFVKFRIVFVPPTAVFERSKYIEAVLLPVPNVKSDVELPVIEPLIFPEMEPFNVSVLEPIAKFPAVRVNAPFTIRL